MAGVWKALVLVVGLAAVACVAHRRQSYEEIVNQAVQFFNQGRGRKPLFRLLETIPPPPCFNITSKIPLSFRIKETECLSTQQRRLQNCAFREGGEERNCTGNFFRARNLRVLTLDCSRDTQRMLEAFLERRERRSVESSQDSPPEADLKKLPPAARDIYEKAKYDIIANILKNF
ncbi:PREDICTED: 15 kDa protein B-like [Elephantulus edwardii]|uniref:15 kDa protein B-like n=1 Tax=Elephantulus edwardii TaxID=28737 RepID=UPI0003F0C1FC|nr:PREDICTED: 15 kDa protein B-like [Elephantulus edwardii]